MIHHGERGGTSSQSSQQWSKQISLPRAVKTRSRLINIHNLCTITMIHPGRATTVLFNNYIAHIKCVSHFELFLGWMTRCGKCLTIIIPGTGHRAIMVITILHQTITSWPLEPPASIWWPLWLLFPSHAAIIPLFHSTVPTIIHSIRKSIT